jgi:hypothetical protein
VTVAPLRQRSLIGQRSKRSGSPAIIELEPTNGAQYFVAATGPIEPRCGPKTRSIVVAWTGLASRRFPSRTMYHLPYWRAARLVGKLSLSGLSRPTASTRHLAARAAKSRSRFERSPASMSKAPFDGSIVSVKCLNAGSVPRGSDDISDARFLGQRDGRGVVATQR